MQAKTSPAPVPGVVLIDHAGTIDGQQRLVRASGLARGAGPVGI